MTIALELNQVTRRYGPTLPPAVQAVDLQVAGAEILALVGESGSGKTTLLRLICGLEKPNAGCVRLNGKPMADERIWIPPERRAIGMVFQDGALFPHLTVEQNIAYGLRRQCRDRKCKRVDNLLRLVGMDGFHKRYPHELSGGERQRLAVARSLAPEPAVVLLDEPFSNLDPALRRALRADVIRILRELRTTAIIVTHDTDDALHAGDRVAVMRQGRIEQIGPPREIYHFPVNGYSARIFGEANEVGGRWIRPEDMELAPASAPDSLPVTVEEIHDAGRHLEIRVRPRAIDSTASWVIYDAAQPGLKPGAPAWVRLKRVRLPGETAARADADPPAEPRQAPWRCRLRVGVEHGMPLGIGGSVRSARSIRSVRSVRCSRRLCIRGRRCNPRTVCLRFCRFWRSAGPWACRIADRGEWPPAHRRDPPPAWPGVQRPVARYSRRLQ